jgi:hypothetical protein
MASNLVISDNGILVDDNGNRTMSSTDKLNFSELYKEENSSLQEMKSNFDYVLINKPDREVFRLCLLTYLIEFIALIFVIYIADRDAKHQEYRISAVYVGGFLSSIFVCSIAYPIMIRLSLVIISRSESSFKDDIVDLVNLQRSIIIVAEAMIFILVAIATFIIVPQQENIVQMMVNCTGIITVAQIDECLYSVFKVKRRFVNEELFSSKMESKLEFNKRKIRIGFICLVIFNTAIFVNVARIYKYTS